MNGQININDYNWLNLSGPAWPLFLLVLVDNHHLGVVAGRGVPEARRGRVQGAAPLFFLPEMELLTKDLHTDSPPLGNEI